MGGSDGRSQARGRADQYWGLRMAARAIYKIPWRAEPSLPEMRQHELDHV